MSRAFSLQPHLSETRAATNPLFVGKVRDIARLYLDPPDRALVLCIDEKSRIQALDRTPAAAADAVGTSTTTDDYERHGTTSLFAALDVQAGTILGKCMPRHRAIEFALLTEQKIKRGGLREAAGGSHHRLHRRRNAVQTIPMGHFRGRHPRRIEGFFAALRR